MAARYLPDSDSAFHNWQRVFVEVADENQALLGLTQAQITALEAAQTAWTASYEEHLTTVELAQAKTEVKDDDRGVYEGIIRTFVRVIQACPTTTDELREEMAITVPDRVRTPAGVPETRPVVTLDMTQRLQHTVDFRDQDRPRTLAKPAGTRGCEVWMKIGTPPTSEAELSFLALDSRTPYVAHFDGAQAGQLVTYWLRWISTRGEPGPWSIPVGATIVG